MAMNVSFKKGVKASLPASRDANTFYYVSDEFALYLGEHLISNEVTLEIFNALEERVKALEDAGFQAQIDAINEALKSIATSETVTAIDNRLKAVEENYLKGTDKTELEGKITSAQTRADNAYALADAAQTSQEVSDAIDAKITALNLAETYEPVGAEQRAKNYSDERLNAVVEQYLTGEGAENTIDTLNEIANWINSDTAGASQIIKDVAANTTNINTISGDLDKVELQLNGIAVGDGAVKTAIDTVDAKFADYTKTVDLGDLATKDSLTAGDVGAYTKTEVDSAISTATSDMATNDSVDGKLEKYAKTEDISEDIAKGVAAKGVTDTLKSAAFVETTAFDAAGTGAAAAAAVQGTTTNTVKDCVDAINTMGETKADKTEVANQNAVVLAEAQKYTDNALTWGIF